MPARHDGPADQKVRPVSELTVGSSYRRSARRSSLRRLRHHLAASRPAPASAALVRLLVLKVPPRLRREEFPNPNMLILLSHSAAVATRGCLGLSPGVAASCAPAGLAAVTRRTIP